MRRLALPLLAVLALAGCMSAPFSGSAEDRAFSCGTGQFVSGFDREGVPTCASGSAPYAGQMCDKGHFVVGFTNDGRPICEPPPFARTDGTLVSRAMPTGKEAAPEALTSARVLGIYGARGDAYQPSLWDLKVMLEMPAGSAPLDVTRLVLRLADAEEVVIYGWSPDALPDGAPARAAFEAEWVRGAGSGHVMQAGDLVQLHFNLGREGAQLPPRTAVQLSILLPESGAPIQADFKTPSTYGSDTVITLR